MAFITRHILPKVINFRSYETHFTYKASPAMSAFFSDRKSYSNVPISYDVIDETVEKKSQESLIKSMKNILMNNSQGRVFAVVHVAGKQFKVTCGDVIVIEGYWPPQVGDEINLDKILLAGSLDFTLVGRPMVQRDLIEVQATVIEKSLSHTKTHFRKKRRKQYMRINFYRIPQTYLRINCIKIREETDNAEETRGLRSVTF